VADIVNIFMEAFSSTFAGNVLAAFGFLAVGFLIGRIIREEKK
tara:strand:- start:548 stop:676 length:129 start_codon:yes stop_codon:yes gene_type:complete